MSQILPVKHFLQKSYLIFTTISHYLRHLAVVHNNTNFATAHSQVTVRMLGGVQVQTSMSVCSLVAHRIPYTSVLSTCTTLLQGHTKSFKKILFPVCHSLFAKLLGTNFASIQQPFSHCHPVLFQGMSMCGPAVSCSGSV